MKREPLQTAALISGAGRTIRSLELSIHAQDIPVRIGVVIAHDEQLTGVRACRELGLEVVIIPGPSGPQTSDLIDQVLLEHQTRLICLGGYLRKFRVGELWTNRVLNIHPALLPDFGGQGMYGNRVHEAVLRSGCSQTGCTVHWVDEEYDEGKHLLQKSCPVRPDDDVDSLAARVFELECGVYPEALSMIDHHQLEAGLCEADRA